jgi:hypothetical protein
LLELQEVTKTVHRIYLHCDVLYAQGYITTIAINILNPLALGFEKGDTPLKKIQSTTLVMFMPTPQLNFSSNNSTMLTLLENFRRVVVRFK